MNIMAGNKNKIPLSLFLHQPSSLFSDSKNRDASPPPSPPCQPASLQRQDSGPQGIKGILKKNRSASVESDHSEGSTQESSLVQQSGVTLSHPESKEEVEEEEEGEEEQAMEEEDEEKEEEINGENDREDQSPTEDIPDRGSFTIDRQQRKGSSSSSRGSFEEMQSPTSDENLEKTSTVSEDVEELDSSLDGSLSSSLKQRSPDVHTV